MRNLGLMLPQPGVCKHWSAHTCKAYWYKFIPASQCLKSELSALLYFFLRVLKE